jgi:hypothetical protein
MGFWYRIGWTDPRKVVNLTPSDYERMFEWLLRGSAARIDGYSRDLAAGRISPRQFRRFMERTIRAAYTSAYRYGASSVTGRTILTDSDLIAIRMYLADELDYLDHFTHDILLHGYSARYLKNRLSLYSDAIRALYWLGKTRRQGKDIMVWWEAHDDGRTCENCLKAEQDSPYRIQDLPGMPGADVCLGLDRCRCKLRFSTASAVTEVA